MKEFNEKIQKKFDQMQQSGKLFRVAITGQQLWELYLASFKDDPIYRDPESSTHNCNLCCNFIRRYGNIVSVSEDFEIETVFDVKTNDEFKPVVKALTAAIKSSVITDVFFETYKELNENVNYEKVYKTNEVFRLGLDKNVKRYTKEEAEKFGRVKPDELVTFHHMHLSVGKAFVDQTGKSVESIMEGFRSAKDVFKRAMQSISLDTLELVKELIMQDSLLDGKTHLYKIEQLIPLKAQYDKLAESQRDNWCWFTSYRLPFAKFGNELIGELCYELTEGGDLNKACETWNKRADPVNYMKTTAPITKRQIEDAKKFVEENNYVESFDRRHAKLDDIKVSEILHQNVGKGEIKTVSIFDGVKSRTTSRHRRSEFDGVEEVSIEKFMKDILPGCESVEVFLKNNHENNMVSMTTSKNPNSKKIFKWDNPYSWTFKGNIAGKSQIKEAVKSFGGNINGVLRFSMIWNEEGSDNSDLDAWCKQPDGISIGYSSGFRKDRGNIKTPCSGILDVDNTDPSGKLAVENIVFDNLKKMKPGTYTFWVNQFAARNSLGFKCEIEFDGETYTYVYDQPVKGNVYVAEVVLENGKFTINHKLPETSSSKEIYGLETNQFHRVNLMCLSPNHWNGNEVGNKHYFFMLEGCKVPTKIRSFHNENLIPELANHRKVIEVLANTNMIEPAEEQLAGLGFNATVRDEVLVKLSGKFKRMLKIKF